MTVKELTADLQVVTSSRVVRVREVVARVPYPLILVPRVELVAGNRKVAERDAGRAGVDAVRFLPVIRPRSEIRVREPEDGLADPEFVQRTVAQHLRELHETLVVVFAVRAGGCRGALKIGGHDRLKLHGPRELAHDPRLRRQLIIEPAAPFFLRVGAGQVDVELGVRGVEDEGPRLALVFEVAEVVQFVLHERTAEHGAELLVVDRLDTVQHRIRRVEAAVAEIASHQARHRVGARFGDRVHLHSRRTPHRRVEPVRDELELRDRILAVLRLTADPDVGRHLLAVDVELKVARLAAVSVGQRRLRCNASGAGIRPTARRQERERNPVAPVHRQLLHLTRIDVAAEARRRGVEERRLPADRHRLCEAARRHLQVDDRRLPDEQLHACARHSGEAGEFGRDAVRADANRQPISAALIGDGIERITRGFVHRSNDDARKHGVGGIGHGAAQHRFLRRGERRKDEGNADDHQPSDDARNHGVLQVRLRRDARAFAGRKLA